MALFCQVDCSQLAAPGVDQLGQICTLGKQSVPCEIEDPKILKTPFCGFETTQEAVDTGNIQCVSIQQKVTCKYQDIISECFEEQAKTGVPTPTLTDATTTPNPASVSVQSSTTLGSGSSTAASAASSTTTSSTDSKGNEPASQAKSTSASQGLSQGAVAGIGIGGAIAGAVIAALVLLLFFTRYKRRHQESVGYSGHLPNYNSDIGRQEKEMSMPTKNGMVVTESYLPQPAEDDAIIGELSRLRDNIKNHTQSFYNTVPVNPQSLDQNLLREVASDTGIQASKLQALLVNSPSRMSALRLCVSWIILSRCDGGGPANTSLLPEEAAAVAALISDIDYKDARKAILASKLKVISGALLQTRPGPAQPLQSAKLEHRIEQAVLTVNEFLTPFIDTTANATSDKRLRNLETIVRRASQLAILLFSQPSSWKLDFGGSGTVQQGTIVIFPGLLETVSEDGIVRQPPRQFHQPEVTAAV